MIKIQNDCCDCAVGGYPCIGPDCELRNVAHYYCDHCKSEVEELRDYEGEQWCARCILKQYRIIEEDDE